MARSDPARHRVVTPDGTAWDRPGAGTWNSGADHVPHAVTASFVELYGPARAAGLRAFFERSGMPAAGMDAAFVHGRMFDRLVPLVGAGSDAPPPPAPILWLATRVHPVFRARAKAATETFGPTRRWRAEAQAWHASERDDWVTRNLALTDDDPAALVDDDAVADHVLRVVAHYRVAIERHFSIKGSDSLPLGDLLAFTTQHGIASADVLALLAGASPSSAVPTRLADVADAVRRSGRRPGTLDEVRACGPDAAAALDVYLREFGWRIVTGYDVDGKALIELPDTIVRSILAVVDRPPVPLAPPNASAAQALHDRVPSDQRSELDERFREALVAYGLRDENGPLTFQWPVGLLRRALLEAGRRLEARGRLDDAEHAVDLRADEAVALLRGASTPTAADVARRRDERRRDSELDPPDRLGPIEVGPAVAAMPASLARGVRAIEAFLETMVGVRDGRTSLAGSGIGTTTYVGRAVVAASPEEAFERLEPGDVLVATCTTPAYNCILPMVGAIVTEEGGGLCHAAIVARELGIAAVVGALDATSSIKDGDLVEVDPVAGVVRLTQELAAAAGA